MAKPARPQKERDFRAGFVCAEAFQRMAEPFIGSSAREVDEGLQAPSSELGEVVASAVNLAFALELYLKTLLAQLDVQVPQHHDLSRLYEALPLPVREPIEVTYDTAWRSRWYGKRASLTIAKGPPDSPIWNDYRSEPKDLANLLARSRDVFQSWRYIWEYTEPPQGLYQLHQFEYGLLLCACEAVRASIVRRLEDTPGPA